MLSLCLFQLEEILHIDEFSCTEINVFFICRNNSAVEIADQMQDVFLNHPVEEWLELIKKIDEDLPEIQTSFGCFAGAVTSIIFPPWLLDVAADKTAQIFGE